MDPFFSAHVAILLFSAAFLNSRLIWTCLHILCLLLFYFSGAEIKPTPTLRVGVRTSHGGHMAFLSTYRTNVQSLQNYSFPGCQRNILCFLSLEGGCHTGINSGVSFSNTDVKFTFSAHVSKKKQ